MKKINEEIKKVNASKWRNEEKEMKVNEEIGVSEGKWRN